MNFKIYADLHLGAPHAEDIVLHYDDDCVYLGDTFDIKNTLTKNINSMLKLQKEHNELCSKKGIVNVAGNHDLLPKEFPRIQIVGDILFTHGHLICYDEAEIAKWDAKTPKGISSLFYFFLSVKNSFSRGTWKPNIEEKEKAAKLAKENGCSHIVIGHTHTTKIVEVTYNDIHIVNVPRGVTNLDFKYRPM